VPQADIAFFVPAALDAVLTLLDTEPLPQPASAEQAAAAPRTILLGGAPVLRPLIERAMARFPGVRIVAIYGMTEVLPIAMAEGTDKLAFDGSGDYVGELMTHIEAHIVDGQLEISGEGIALGYLIDLPEKPLTVVRTGDIARLEGSRLILAGRSKDMFIRGTTNVYPGLYEPVIAGLPGVQDVAMVGVPNIVGDDRLVIVIVPEASGAAARSTAARSPAARFTTAHPTITSVTRALPGLIDAAVLPDLVLVTDSLPKSGRSNKLNRATLTAEVTEFVRTAGLLP
jgi:acyl-CoA synthetase (AMP-forming)/AMP-acid ligase II